nr:unnamed protein product [Digitaria exilis]
MPSASHSPSMPSPCRRRHTEASRPSESRDWAELPTDAVATVLGKLVVDDVCVETGAVPPSRSPCWRARFGPGLAAARLAVWKSAGRWEVYETERVADDRILLYLAGRYKNS